MYNLKNLHSEHTRVTAFHIKKLPEEALKLPSTPLTGPHFDV